MAKVKNFSIWLNDAIKEQQAQVVKVANMRTNNAFKGYDHFRAFMLRVTEPLKQAKPVHTIQAHSTVNTF